jgi:hypothetical protein
VDFWWKHSRNSSRQNPLKLIFFKSFHSKISSITKLLKIINSFESNLWLIMHYCLHFMLIGFTIETNYSILCIKNYCLDLLNTDDLWICWRDLQMIGIFVMAFLNVMILNNKKIFKRYHIIITYNIKIRTEFGSILFLNYAFKFQPKNHFYCKSFSQSSPKNSLYQVLINSVIYWFIRSITESLHFLNFYWPHIFKKKLNNKSINNNYQIMHRESWLLTSEIPRENFEPTKKQKYKIWCLIRVACILWISSQKTNNKEETFSQFLKCFNFLGIWETLYVIDFYVKLS